MSSSSVRLAALCALTLLVIVLGYALLSSSDFPRGLFKPPQQTQSQYFPNMDSLNANYVHTDASSWNTLSTYLGLLNDYDLKVVLKKNQALGYLLQYYSNSQYMEYQAEWAYNDTLWDLWNANGTGYYYYEQSPGGEIVQGTPSGGASWHLIASGTPTWVQDLEGPKHILHTDKDYISDEWKPGWPQGDTTAYRHRIWVKANRTGLPDSTVLFKLVLIHVYRYDTPTEKDGVEDLPDVAHIANYSVDSVSVTAGQYGSSTAFLPFCIPVEEGVGDTAWLKYPPGIDTCSFVSCYYKFYWTKRCDLWIDKIETADMKRGYDFLWTNANRQVKLGLIHHEADSIQDICLDTLEGFLQGDTPRRISFLAYRAVNDTMRNGLKPGYAYFRNDNLDK